jgi:hypothetical protein
MITNSWINWLDKYFEVALLGKKGSCDSTCETIM